MVFPLLWLCFDVYVQNTDILNVSWLIAKFTSTFSFGSDWGAGTLTGQLAVKKVAYWRQVTIFTVSSLKAISIKSSIRSIS